MSFKKGSTYTLLAIQLALFVVSTIQLFTALILYRIHAKKLFSRNWKQGYYTAEFLYQLCIGLIMGGKLYEPERRIEHASHDQTYLVHGWGRWCGLNMMACVSMFSEV